MKNDKNQNKKFKKNKKKSKNFNPAKSTENSGFLNCGYFFLINSQVILKF